jgi:hypothetical protein
MNPQQIDLEAHKRELLMRSEGYRQKLYADVREAAAAVAWVPKTFSTLRFASPILLMLAPAAAFVAGRWAFGRAATPILGARPARSGLFGKLIAAVRIFQQVKPLWDGYRKARGV